MVHLLGLIIRGDPHIVGQYAANYIRKRYETSPCCL